MTWPTAKESALVIVSILAVLAVAEAGLRVLQYQRDGTSVWTMLPGYRESTFQRSPFLPFGPRVNWTFQRSGDPSWTRFNDLGLRMPGALPAREPGEVRILAMGGSTTENVWNDLGIHWPLALECLARSEGRADVRVLNAGMSAYSSAHSLVRYQLDLVEVEPDIVIVMHNVNDLTVTYNGAAVGAGVDPNYLVKYGGKGYTGQVDESDLVFSRLYNVLASTVRGGKPVGALVEETYSLAAGERMFRRNLTSLVRAIAASGAVPVLVSMPRSGDPTRVEEVRQGDGSGAGIGPLPLPERFFSDFDRFNEVVRRVAEEQGAIFIDMARTLVEHPDTFVDVVHYSTRGIRDFARALYASESFSLPPTQGARLRQGVISCEGVL